MPPSGCFLRRRAVSGCPSAGFNAHPRAVLMFIAAFVSALAKWPHSVQTNRA